MDSLPLRRKINLTFAPEAGTERLRRIINKAIPEEVMLNTIAAAFNKGWNLKLYFMIGLPTETIEDIQGIIDLVHKISHLRGKPGGRQPQLRVSVSTLIPKPHTPYQWLGQEEKEQLLPKLELLKQGLRRARIGLSWHDPNASQLEACLSRGDRRLSKVIYHAWQLGCKFDAWHEHFNYHDWLVAFQENGADPAFYAHRQRSLDELLPWEHINTGISSSFLKKEYERIWQDKETPDCRHGPCNACGLQHWQPSCQQKFKTTATKPPTNN
jgi:radical SAM superfamily enzyme YgiQ (UPF0313 family)